MATHRLETYKLVLYKGLQGSQPPPGHERDTRAGGCFCNALRWLNFRCWPGHPHKPYRGAGQALTDLLGGQVQVMFDVTSSSIGYIRAGEAARTGSNHGDARGGAAGRADRERVGAGVRSDLPSWRWRAQEHACRDHRQAKPGDQRRPRRSQDEGPACRPWRHAAYRNAGGLRQAAASQVEISQRSDLPLYRGVLGGRNRLICIARRAADACVSQFTHGGLNVLHYRRSGVAQPRP